jgi:NADPH:quinone reductase-like Zn-dependent oxidoreductase
VVFPGVLGWDLSGTIIAVGAGVRELAAGDKVFAWASHTELCVVTADLLAKVPIGLDLAKAAALPLVSATGCQLITVATRPRAGETVFVSGANGAVGR